jgi:hypothetical protein
MIVQIFFACAQYLFAVGKVAKDNS